MFDGPDDVSVMAILAHGAGAPMDSASLTAPAKALNGAGLRVARFEFEYMAGRSNGAGRKPPPRTETLNPQYLAAVDALGAKGPLIIGGKSMGGRVASMVADELFAAGRIHGLLCLGYRNDSLAGFAVAAHVDRMVHDDPNIHPQAAVAPGYLANHAARVFNRMVDASLRPHGLSLALIGPILHLSWKGPLRQRDLVAASAVKQPAMVALLDKLEAGGLVVRAVASGDRRASIVHLTERGEAAAEIGRRALYATNALGVQNLSHAEAAVLTGLLHRFIANLEHPAEHIHHA